MGMARCWASERPLTDVRPALSILLGVYRHEHQREVQFSQENKSHCTEHSHKLKKPRKAA
jgi:hypothetical protein